MEIFLIIGTLALLVVAIDSAMNVSKVKNAKEKQSYQNRFTLSAGALAVIVICFVFQVLVTSYRESESQGHSPVSRITKFFSSKSDGNEDTSTWRPEGKRNSDSSAAGKPNSQQSTAAEVKEEPLDEEAEIRRYEKAFAKTLRVTPEEFQRRFNDNVEKFGYDKSLQIKNPKNLRGTLHYDFGDGVVMILSIDGITKNVKDISVTAENADAENNIAVVYRLAVSAANPKLTDAEVADVANLSANAETVHEGFRYARALVEGGGVSCTIAVE